jgi:predicted Zn-dependent peptidase
VSALLLVAVLLGGVRLPASTDFVLPNGLRVILVPNREVPLVSFEVRLAAGGMHDAPGKEGLARLLGDLLTKGAGKRDAEAFQAAVDSVGGTFGVGAGTRWLTVRGEFLREHVDLGFELLADALRRPTLAPSEFEKERGLAIDGIRAARQDPATLIGTYWQGWIFRGQKYARVPSGDEATLAAITLDDVRAARARLLRPENAWLAVAGSFDPAEMRRRIEARFGDWEAGGEALADRAPVKQLTGGSVLLVDKPDALQTYFRFGGPGFDWSDPDYPARYLANTILGGRFTSRLNTALRIEAGLTYGADSSFDDAHGGVFRVSSYTATATSAEALALALKVYLGFVADGMTQAELDSARAYVKGQYAPDNLETADQAAAMILSLESNGLSRDIVNGFFERLDKLTLAEVNRVTRERFPRDDLAWVVIGRAEVLAPIVAKYGKVTRIPIDGPGFAPR